MALDVVIEQMFIAGMGSFLIAQLTYAALFWSHRSGDPQRGRLATMSFSFMALTVFFIVPNAGELSASVMVYVLAIGAMLMGAAVCDRPVNRLFAGALLFAISDSLIGVNQFIVAVPFASIAIMTFYYCAQFLLVQGALAETKNHDQKSAVLAEE